MLERRRLFSLQYPQMAHHISALVVQKCLPVSISAPVVRKSTPDCPPPYFHKKIK